MLVCRCNTNLTATPTTTLTATIALMGGMYTYFEVKIWEKTVNETAATAYMSPALFTYKCVRLSGSGQPLCAQYE